MATNWFSYNGVGDPALPESYLLMTTKPTCVTGGSSVCAIYLDDNGNPSPTNISPVFDYIANAQATLVSQPTTGPKRYVYVKNI